MVDFLAFLFGVCHVWEKMGRLILCYGGAGFVLCELRKSGSILVNLVI